MLSDKWAIYEECKAILRAANLTPREYEMVIALIAKGLKL